MSETKYLHMIQCVESLRSLIEQRIRSLKKNKYLANAEWNFIVNFFRIENPYIYQIKRNENTVEKQQSLEIHSKEYDDLREDTRIRLIHIQKVIISNMFMYNWNHNFLICRRVSGDNIVIMKFVHKLFEFFHHYAMQP